MTLLTGSSSPSTVAEAESLIQQGLERLRDAPLNEAITSALAFIAPKGFRVVVQLEEDGRKKRSTASISNWNHETGEIVMYFEPLESTSSEQTSLQGLSVPSKESGPSQALPLQPAKVDTAVFQSGSATDAEVRQCCEALSDAEKQGRQFYAIKWFRDTFLADRDLGWTSTLQDRQRVLNRAIQDGFIETRSIPNPRNPAFPTTTLQLNREKSLSLLGSRFRPIVSRGEPASEIIMRERGER